MTLKQKKKENIQEEFIPKDFIGREKYVQNIAEIIKAANTNRSWTFAVNGAWGIGKSFVLNMLQRKLISEDCVVVKYDAWKNDFYQDPLIAILHNILDQIDKSSIGKEILDGIKNGVGAFYEILKSISIIETIDKKTKKAYQKLTQDHKLTNKLEIAENFVSFNDALDLVKEELRKITKKQKLVILVDELDRCEPDYSLTVLNRLHNLFDIPNVVVIVAINKQQLENIIKAKYNTQNSQYLEKFFDLNFNLPVKEMEDIRIGYANQFLSTFLSDEELEQTELFRSILRSYLPGNARTVVKFFETLKFIVKEMEDKNKQYAYICLYSYVLLNKNLKSYFYDSFGENTQTFSNFFIQEVLSDSLTNSYFGGQLKEYIKENRVERYGQRAGLFHYKDETINLFLGLVILTYFINDNSVLTSIKTYFGVEFTEDDINEIKDTIALIKLLNKGQI